jgi:hypothetical protein
MCEVFGVVVTSLMLRVDLVLCSHEDHVCDALGADVRCEEVILWLLELFKCIRDLCCLFRRGVEPVSMEKGPTTPTHEDKLPTT